MSRLTIVYPPGATPLDPDEMGGLIPNYITTQGELNQLERTNILEATQWALGKTTHDCLNISFCMDLHKRMFSKVWKWAGTVRLTDKTPGVPKEQINMKLKGLIDNTAYWIQHQVYDFDEIAARFHHGLVFVHVFANGNGRHARLMTEVVQTVNGETLFTWGSSDLYSSESQARKDYISALKAADQNNFAPLLKFVRS